MIGESIFTNIKQKFSDYIKHRKQLKALRNYAQVAKFEHRGYIDLLSKCLNEAFLDDKEADFLCHMVDKYAVNVLDWSYRTPWLKGEMKRMSAKGSQISARRQNAQAEDQLMMFEDAAGLKTAVMVESIPQLKAQQVDVPVELLGEFESPWKRRNLT
jgi:hypothetical protein